VVSDADSFYFVAQNGVKFRSSQLDLGNGITYEAPPDTSKEDLMCAVFEMASNHAILELEVFFGYDKIEFTAGHIED